jgi:GNAT superfamily N-acetyltransferase
VIPRTLNDPIGQVKIRQESFAEAHSYTQISSTFRTDKVLDVLEYPTGLELRERPLVQPFHKDYDAISDPTQWPHQFDLSHWAVFAAYRDERRVGAAVAAFDTPGVDMLEERKDLVVLWDLRVSTDVRRCGVGAALFDAVELWASLRNCRQLKVETQNTNVAACRFYASRGCKLMQANRGAYPELPLEIQLIWAKSLDQPLRGCL